MYSHAAKYFAGQFIARGTAYLYSLLVAKLLSKDGFVEFTLFLLAANIYSRAANFSLNMLMVKIRFSTGEADVEAAQDKLYRFAVTISSSLTILGLALVWLSPLTQWIGTTPVFATAVLLSGYLLSIENNAIEVFQSKFQSTRYLAYMLCFTAMLLLLSGGSYLTWGFGSATTPILAYLIAQAVVILGFRNFRFIRQWEPERYKRYLVLGAPLFLYAVSSYLNRYLEMFMLRHFVASDRIADFAYVFRASEVLSLVSIAAGGVASPTLFRLLNLGTAESEGVKNLHRMLWLQTVIFAVFAILVVPATHRVFPEFVQSLRLLPWLVFLAYLNMGINNLQIYLLHFSQNPQILYTNLGVLGFSFAANYLLIPHLGIFGCALVKNAAAAITLVTYYFYSTRSPLPPRSLNLERQYLIQGVLLSMVLVTLAGFIGLGTN